MTLTPEAEIRQLITEQMNAIHNKNVDGIMAHYVDDLVLYDATPPLQIMGANALRNVWEQCFPYFTDGFGYEIQEPVIKANDDLAFAYWLFRFTNMGEGHESAQTWMRWTATYQKISGKWKIIHEHISVPFDPHTSQAVFTLQA
jgi:ketosteroid isomerase-like protein